MTIKLTKSISVNIISTDYGVSVGGETKTCDLTYEVTSVNVENGTAIATLSLAVNGNLTGATPTYSFVYDGAAGDVFSQAEQYILSLEDFAEASKS